jgi:hypothetical protein
MPACDAGLYTSPAESVKATRRQLGLARAVRIDSRLRLYAIIPLAGVSLLSYDACRKECLMLSEVRAYPPSVRRCVCCALAIIVLHVCVAAQADIRARCRTAFDADYFYVAADVDKQTLRGSVSAPFQNPLQDDAILIGIAAADAPDKRVEMAVSVAQGAQLYRGADRNPLRGVDDFLTAPDGSRMLFKYRLRARGKLNSQPQIDNGFTVEVAIPWIEIGGPPQQGDRLKFSIAVLNTVEGEAPVVSLSPAITSPQDTLDAGKWATIVFVDAPTASVAGAPGAIVCARVYNVKPVIDGTLDDAEWSRITAFAFGSGMEATGPMPGSAGAARTRGPLDLKQAPPAPGDGRWMLLHHPAVSDAKPLTRQVWPRLVFARYLVDRQADPRKPLPLAPVADAAGRSLLITHPMDGTGPWYSYDRIDWHRIQLTRMREAGVDVAAVTFAPGRAGRLAATALGSALAALEASDADHPLVCLWLDASALPEPAQDTASRLYAGIREFHQCVPPRFVAAVPLSAENGGGLAVPVVVAGLDPARVPSEAMASLRAALRARFRSEFGRDLILLSTIEGPNWDGVVLPTVDAPYTLGGSHAVRAAAVCAGVRPRQPEEHPLFRRTRDTYRTAWRSAITDQPDWVFIESWNDYAGATEIAPTLEYGLEYLDMTQAFMRLWRRGAELSGQVISASVPARPTRGGTCTIRVKARNTGTQTWLPGGHAIWAEWKTGQASGEPRGRRREARGESAVPRAVEMGGLCTVTLRVPAPEADGPSTLLISIVRLDRSGGPASAAEIGAFTLEPDAAVEAVSGSSGSSPTAPAAALIADMPVRVAETGSVHTWGLTVRNDGNAAWEAGTATVRVRLFEQASEAAEPTLLDMADASAVIGEAVQPGAETSVQVPIAFVRPDGTPFRLSANTDSRYLLRAEITVAGLQPATSVLACQEVQMVEADYGPQFFNDFTPTELPGDRRVSVVIGVRNRGPQTWLKRQVAVGYHWYYLDGVEAVWQDEVFPINVDMAPGSQIADVGAWITAPPHDGVYWLVWDLRVGDTWASTQLSARAYDTRVQLVRVARGRLQMLDLAAAANVDVTAGVADPPSAGFDGTGAALPAEMAPPFATGMPACSTIWLPVSRTGPDINRRISFRWLPRGKPNGVRCSSQTIPVAPPKTATQTRMVHVLAAANAEGATMSVTLRFANGSEQLTSFPVSLWTGKPANGEEIACAFPYTRKPNGDAPGPAAHLYRYAVPVSERTPLVAIQLSDSPNVVVMGISVER